MTTNLNDFIRDIVLELGEPFNSNIAEGKQLARAILRKLAAMPDDDAMKIVRRYRVKSTQRIRKGGAR